MAYILSMCCPAQILSIEHTLEMGLPHRFEQLVSIWCYVYMKNVTKLAILSTYCISVRSVPEWSIQHSKRNWCVWCVLVNAAVLMRRVSDVVSYTLDNYIVHASWRQLLRIKLIVNFLAVCGRLADRCSNSSWDHVSWSGAVVLSPSSIECGVGPFGVLCICVDIEFPCNSCSGVVVLSTVINRVWGSSLRCSISPCGHQFPFNTCVPHPRTPVPLVSISLCVDINWSSYNTNDSLRISWGDLRATVNCDWGGLYTSSTRVILELAGILINLFMSLLWCTWYAVGKNLSMTFKLELSWNLNEFIRISL